jgi:hypothetical protein
MAFNEKLKTDLGESVAEPHVTMRLEERGQASLNRLVEMCLMTLVPHF